MPMLMLIRTIVLGVWVLWCRASTIFVGGVDSSQWVAAFGDRFVPVLHIANTIHIAILKLLGQSSLVCAYE